MLLFADAVSLSNLKHYNDMSTPLPFVVYGLWGRLVGTDLPHLRMLSLIVAVASFFLMYRLFLLLVRNPWFAAAAVIFIAMNPYMIGSSLFVFTDMSAVLFLVLTMLAVAKDRPWLLGVSLAGAVLCRQYLVFAVLAVGVYYLVHLFRGGGRKPVEMLAAVMLSCLPMAGLMLLWRGAAPDCEFRRVYLMEPLRYHVVALHLYIAQMFMYMAPFAILAWRRLYRNRLIIFMAVILSVAYWVAPIQAPPFTTMGTTGYFHRILRRAVGSESIEQLVFYLSFLLALPILLVTMADILKRLRSQRPDVWLFVSLLVPLFLLVMPLSYLHWEKYFIPLMPVMILVLSRGTGGAGDGRGSFTELADEVHRNVG